MNSAAVNEFARKLSNKTARKFTCQIKCSSNVKKLIKIDLSNEGKFHLSEISVRTQLQSKHSNSVNMVSYKIGVRAYTKMILHAAKYPHCAVNGLLLSSGEASANVVEIVDVMPLFHQCLHVSPMAEVALIQIEAFAAAKNLQISGYYAACELLQDHSIEKAPGLRIADKIVENNPGAALILIDNALSSEDDPALHVWQNKENHWVSASFTLNQKSETLDAVDLLIERGAMKDLYDFDNHLDNIKNDWTNMHLNHDLKQLLSMY